MNITEKDKQRNYLQIAGKFKILSNVFSLLSGLKETIFFKEVLR